MNVKTPVYPIFPFLILFYFVSSYLQVDLWGLGCIMFELLFDKNPFDVTCTTDDCPDREGERLSCVTCRFVCVLFVFVSV